jgi:transketolase
MDTMRERFTTVTARLLDQHPHLAVVLADIGVAAFADVGAAENHPERVINVGIREQLMISVASGLALEGMRPIVHSYTPFLVERPFEQIKLDLTHQGVAAVLVSIGASHDASTEGRTHQSPGDVALLSSLPGWEIHVPGHPDEVERVLHRAVAAERSSYIRLASVSNGVGRDDSGGLVPVRRGRSAVVIAVGPMLDPVLEATRDLDVSVLYAATVRPFDHRGLRSSLADARVVIVEPYLEGTSAGEVSRGLEDVPHRFLSIGVQNLELRRYGRPAEHDAAHGLDVAGVRRRISGFVAAGSTTPSPSRHLPLLL